MKKFDLSPQDEVSYQKSMLIIKSKLLDNLSKNFTDEIDYFFAKNFVQIVKPYIERLLQKEITKNIEKDLGSFAFQLIQRKYIEEPQMELLRQYLSE